MNKLSMVAALAVASGGIARLAACPVGPRIMFAPDTGAGAGAGGGDLMKELREVAQAITAKQVETTEAVQKQRSEVAELGKSSEETNRKLQELGSDNMSLRARLLEVEQKLARDGGADTRPAAKSWGQQATEGDAFQDFAKKGFRGTMRIEVDQPDPYLHQRAITNLGSIVQVDRQAGIVPLPSRRFTIRDLLAPGSTTSNAIEYVKETGFTNNAAPVAENTTKPQSTIAYAAATANVRTIAHWIAVSRQSLDDAPALRAQIDGRLRYGLQLVEETQLLTGDGSGQNLNGLITQATAYSTARNATGDQRADVISHALQQAEDAGYPADAVVLNSADWEKIRLVKDGQGRYIGNGPFDAVENLTLWGKRVIATPALSSGSFLAGAFYMSAQIFDRMTAEVLLSTEDQDNFVKNMVTARAEERLALAVYTPAGLVYGTFGTIPVPAP